MIISEDQKKEDILSLFHPANPELTFGKVYNDLNITSRYTPENYQTPDAVDLLCKDLEREGFLVRALVSPEDSFKDKITLTQKGIIASTRGYINYKRDELQSQIDKVDRERQADKRFNITVQVITLIIAFASFVIGLIALNSSDNNQQERIDSLNTKMMRYDSLLKK